MRKAVPMTELEVHVSLLNLAILLIVQPDYRILPRQLKLMENHVRHCAACAALMQPTGTSPASGEHTPSRGGSIVVDIQEWLRRKSDAKLVR